jgi:DNA polymerase-3 subunit epsilon
MRQIILDTETTGLNARLGDRIIEVGCLEMVNRRFTGNNWHRYLNPDKAIEEGAKAVHGISDEFLADKPRFADIASEFLEYVRDAELVIHNAAFDMEFLDAELARLKLGRMADHGVTVTDTLKMARELHPGKRNSLDALCERYEINNKHRTLHGALLDAELLAEVYLAMTRGQDSLAIGMDAGGDARGHAAQAAQVSVNVTAASAAGRVPLKVLEASDEELAAHDKVLAGIDKESGGKCVWLKAGKPA